MQEIATVLHNKVPNRIRFSVPAIKHKRTYTELLKQTLLKDTVGKGIYHAEPNITTGTILIKYHPALHNEAEVVELVRTVAAHLTEGKIEITAKHKNPRLGKMPPGAFFARELVVNIGGTIAAALILAALGIR